MKPLVLHLVCCFLIGMSCVSTKSFDRQKCSAIIDSAKLFIQTDVSAINTRPSINDKETNRRLDKLFQSFSFSQLSCLLNNKDIAVKYIGFQYAAFAHTDSVLQKYSDLLADTTMVQFYRADGEVSSKIKFGELLSGIIQTIKGR